MSTDNECAIGAVVFSMKDDHVWVSWPGKSESVKLGSWVPVTYMMRDFLTQCEVGERLAVREERSD